MSKQSSDLCPSLHDFMVGYRHDLHRHPELGFEEERTTKKLAVALRDLAITVHQGCGVVGVLTTGNSGRVIALRAEMDALPLNETASHDHISTVSGKMHACGHDGHMAMLLGAAKHLADTRNFDGSVVFIFQPNEENGLGAQALLREDVLGRLGVEEIYAIHNLPGAPLGEISTRPGLICSSESLFEIEIIGQGGHASMPDTGVDAILVGAELVQALQAIVARKMPPSSGAVVSVTEFTTDGARNTLPGHAVLKGDARARSPEDRSTIERLMRQIAAGVAVQHEVEIRVDFRSEFVETINDPDAAVAAIDVARGVSDRIIADRTPMSFSEDFAHFLANIPGCFLLLGNGTDGPHAMPLHASQYDFNDDALMIGAQFWVRLVEARLPKRNA